mmetsp:Transcript_22101/g.48190  ORF Transcript_22101/g.48190 Transcript_22101/m.48190 type:complete len:248 (+) Transcript_22101:606-1349(+)
MTRPPSMAWSLSKRRPVQPFSVLSRSASGTPVWTRLSRVEPSFASMLMVTIEKWPGCHVLKRHFHLMTAFSPLKGDSSTFSPSTAPENIKNLPPISVLMLASLAVSPRMRFVSSRDSYTTGGGGLKSYLTVTLPIFDVSSGAGTYNALARTAGLGLAASPPPACTVSLSCLTNSKHAALIFGIPSNRTASLSGRFSLVSSSHVTVISRSSYVSSLRSGILTLPLASNLALPSSPHSSAFQLMSSSSS